MKFSTILAPVALLVSTVSADTSTIETALLNINALTNTLGATVGAWDGKLLSALTISSVSGDLLDSIKDGKKVAKKSPALDDNQAIFVALATIDLANSVNASLSNIIAAKKKFDKILLTPIILINLLRERKATQEFSAEVVNKVPAWAKDLAVELTHPIETAFEKAIDLYNGPF